MLRPEMQTSLRQCCSEYLTALSESRGEQSALSVTTTFTNALPAVLGIIMILSICGARDHAETEPLLTKVNVWRVVHLDMGRRKTGNATRVKTKDVPNVIGIRKDILVLSAIQAM